MTDRAAIVGAGRAGRGLARALRASGIDVSALVARNPLADDPDDGVTGDLGVLLRGATVVLLAVQDAALPEAVAALAAAALESSVVVLQLSGGTPDSVLDPVRRCGHAAGTFHPLVPLVDPARAAESLRGAWIGVGGDARATHVAARLAGALRARTLAVPAGSDGRAVYHAAAVIASNFPIALAALAERLFASTGIDTAAARGATWHLMHTAVDNLGGRDPGEALSGPIIRGDVATAARHLDALSPDPLALDVYVSLSALIASVVGDRIPANVVRELLLALQQHARRGPT